MHLSLTLKGASQHPRAFSKRFSFDFLIFLSLFVAWYWYHLHVLPCHAMKMLWHFLMIFKRALKRGESSIMMVYCNLLTHSVHKASARDALRHFMTAVITCYFLHILKNVSVGKTKKNWNFHPSLAPLCWCR